MVHVLYLAHDLADPAIRRRVIMLKRGGATVELLGFSRADAPSEIEGVAAVNLGKTADGRFAQRAAAVGMAFIGLRSRLSGKRRPDVVIARNLETLALANRASQSFGGSVPIVYECLDIHRLLLGQGLVGRAMRMVEQWFGRDAKMILTSSPAFKREYFDRLSALRAPVVLLENKALQSSDSNAVCNGRRLENRPWRIGWFGAIRCAKSLKLLADFSRMADGRFEIVLRGRPAYSEFENFDAFVAAEPFMRFEGPYRNPEDLHEIYGEVDFAWAIDCFEEGQNSKWLLPNRLYEGCLHGAIPIAVAGTQTAAVLKQNNIGITLSEVTSSALTAAMEGLDRRRLDSLAASIAAVDRQAWVADEADCRNLVATLAALQPSAQFALQEQVQINSSYAI